MNLVINHRLSHRLSIFALVLLLALVTTRATAQEPQKQDDDQSPVRLNSTLVQVPAIVTDQAGKFITDLTKIDFAVYEDGKRQEVALFTAIKQPFNAVLVLDTSNSAQDRLRAIQNTATTFTKQLGAGDRMMVITFDNEVHELTELTRDQKELESTIRGAESGFGKLLYEAMVHALDKLRDTEGRRAVVLFSDGVDMKSIEATAEKTMQMAEEIGAVIYVVRFDTRWFIEAEARKHEPDRSKKQLPFDVDGRIPLPPEYGGPDLSSDNPEIPAPEKPRIEIGSGGSGGTMGTPRRQPPVVYDPGSRPPLTLPEHHEADPITETLDKLYGEADQFMLTITSRTGGRVYKAETFENTRAAFAAIADELHNLYMLGYYPTANRRDNKLHKIKVEVARKNVQIRARSGYQTQKADNKK
ncbi:MAG: Ca-activated chloride channel [Blastocatellia bacterium]